MFWHFKFQVSPVHCSRPFPQGTVRPFFLPILAEFQERIPSKFLKLTSYEDDSVQSGSLNRSRSQLSHCRICVLPPRKLTSLDTFSDQTAARHHPLKLPTLHERDTCFVMIQLVAALKFLQSQAIEDVGSDLDAFLLMQKSNNNEYHQQGEPPNHPVWPFMGLPIFGQPHRKAAPKWPCHDVH